MKVSILYQESSYRPLAPRIAQIRMGESSFGRKAGICWAKRKTTSHQPPTTSH